MYRSAIQRIIMLREWSRSGERDRVQQINSVHRSQSITSSQLALITAATSEDLHLALIERLADVGIYWTRFFPRHTRTKRNIFEQFKRSWIVQRRKIISIYLYNFLTCYDEDDRSDIIASIGRVYRS